VSEELGELDEAVAQGSPERIESELGDVLFALVNFARHQGVNAELALRKTADRFAGRFAHVETRVREQQGGFPRDKDGKATREFRSRRSTATGTKQGARAVTTAVDPVGRLPEEWRETMRELGEKPFRAEQVFRWIHERGVLDPEQMTDLGSRYASGSRLTASRRPPK